MAINFCYVPFHFGDIFHCDAVVVMKNNKRNIVTERYFPKMENQMKKTG